MQKAVELVANGINHGRRTVSGIQAADASRKIDQPIAVDVFHDCAFGFCNKDGSGMIGALHDGSIPSLHERLRSWAGN